MADKKISELDLALQINNDAVFPMSQDNAGEPTTFKAGITQLGAEIMEDMTFSNLQTTNKTPIGAINEIAQGGGGTTDYDDLENKPQINSVELSGNKSLDDLGIQPSEISDTASGSIATFTDGADNVPVKAFECDIVAQQASGTPTPASPLSITGFSQADISVSGKNLWSENSTISGTFRSAIINFVLPVGTYTFSAIVTSSDTDATKSLILLNYNDGTTASVYLNRTTRSSETITTTKPIVSVRFFASTSGALSTDDTFSFEDFQIEVGTTATEYEPYKSNTYLVEFGQTIYGGKLVYQNGQWAIEATHGNITFNGTQPDSDFTLSAMTGFTRIAYNPYNDIGVINATFISNILEYVSSPTQYGEGKIWSNSTAARMFLGLPDSVTDKSQMQAWFSSNPTQVVFELATPVIIPITSSTRVKTISGANNIFSNTGDVELEYFTDKADEIAELVEEEIDGERQEHNVVKSYTAQLTSSQYGWFTFVDENGNDLLVTNGVPLSASAIADSKYYSGLFVQQPSGKIYFKVVDTNNSSASSFAPVGTSLSNITFNLSYLKF